MSYNTRCYLKHQIIPADVVLFYYCKHELILLDFNIESTTTQMPFLILVSCIIHWSQRDEFLVIYQCNACVSIVWAYKYL